MNYNIYTTDSFDKELKKLTKKFQSLKKEYSDLIISLKENPTQGDSLGKDCYKIRIAISSKGKGKSGGERIITCVKLINNLIYLLAIFDKSEKETITDKELDMLLKRAGLL